MIPRPSAADLVDFFVCEHRASLEREVASGRRVAPPASPEIAIAAERSAEQERAQRPELEAAGIAVVEIGRDGSIEAAQAATLAACADGAEAIAGAVVRGRRLIATARVLRRVAGRSRFGPWSYEPLGFVPAGRASQTAILELCAIVDALSDVCGTPFAEAAFQVRLGDGRIERYAVAEFAAFYLAVRTRYLETADARAQPTRPEKISSCSRCRWSAHCADERRRRDDVSLVARIRRDQVVALRGHGLTTLGALAAATDEARPPKLALRTWAKLRAQAALQAAHRDDGRPRYELLPAVRSTGFALLPLPSWADVYFDIEGDPFAGGGLEYLFGRTYRTGEGTPTYEAVWAADRAQERAAAAEFLAFVRARRARDPALHVYHYASYERTALARIVGGTPLEAELDALVRAGTFVDLYAVVRGGLRLSTPSYSIKALEAFYRGRERTTAIVDGIGSIVAYERYLRGGDPELLAEIRDYNQDDCDSTLELHAWLLERQHELHAAARARGPRRGRAERQRGRALSR